MDVLVCVFQSAGVRPAPLPDILIFDPPARTVGAWTWTTDAKQRQKINSSAFTHWSFRMNLFSGAVELTLGLDAGWRRGAGL